MIPMSNPITTFIKNLHDTYPQNKQPQPIFSLYDQLANFMSKYLHKSKRGPDREQYRPLYPHVRDR